MTTLTQWISGARPQTLGAALAPVIAGTGASAAVLGSRPAVLPAALAALVAVALQVGVNYANDYSDGVRGTDGKTRVGPARLVGSGAASPSAVKAAAIAALVVGALAGVALVALSGKWWLLAVGAVCIAAAWGYTGGPKPYGYIGLGEVAVFIFFGPVATLGTQYTQAGGISLAGVAAGCACGALSVALMMINNIRDIPGDITSGKKTLAVRLGDRRARQVFVAVVAFAGVSVVACALAAGSWYPLLALIIAVRVVPAAHDVISGAKGPELIDALPQIGSSTLFLGLALGTLLAVIV